MHYPVLISCLFHALICPYRSQALAAKASTPPVADVIPMDSNPSYETVHVYEHIDKKDSKQ